MTNIILAREVPDMDFLQIFTAINNMSDINIRQSTAIALCDQQLKWKHGYQT